MCGEAEIASRDESLPPAERERAASQLDELRRLARIVDGLMLLAKADAGQVALKLEPVRFDELVRDNFADAQILAEPHGIQVELAGCGEITVRGDRHRLRQLLLNLADNAAKYNQPQGRYSAGNVDSRFRPVLSRRPGAQPDGGWLRPGIEHRAMDCFRAWRKHHHQV
jgi:signal transduction histidine kinase